MLKTVSESIQMAQTSNRSISLSDLLPNLSQHNGSLKTFSDFFYSFSRTTSSSFNSSFVLMISPELDLQIKNNEDSCMQHFMSALKLFISEFHSSENIALLEDPHYYKMIQKNINPYIYARSIDELYLLSSTDSTFSYIKESLNVQ
jgi:hypothetical protein